MTRHRRRCGRPVMPSCGPTTPTLLLSQPSPGSARLLQRALKAARPFTIAARSRTTCARVFAMLRPLISSSIAQLIGLGIQQTIQRLLHGTAHDLAQPLLNLGLVDLDDFAQAR